MVSGFVEVQLIIRGGGSVDFASCVPLIRGPANRRSVLVRKPPASLGQTQGMMGAVINLASAGPVSWSPSSGQNTSETSFLDAQTP